MPDTTDRLGLPLLSAGQAQKEITHNEAIARLTAVVQPVVESVAPASVPTAPAAGQCWIVGTGATGAWAGQDGALAAWTSGGWRFVPPFEGMQAWSIADAVPVLRVAGVWTIGITRATALRIGGLQVVGSRLAAIANPSGGATADAEARAAVSAILGAMRSHGLIAT